MTDSRPNLLQRFAAWLAARLAANLARVTVVDVGKAGDGLLPALTNGYRDLLDRMDEMDGRLGEVERLTRAVAEHMGLA